MKVLNYKDETVQLTELEAKVYNAIIENGEMEDCHAEHPENVSIDAEIPMNQLRGVMASLSKKGVCYVDEIISGCGDFIILFEDK